MNFRAPTRVTVGTVVLAAALVAAIGAAIWSIQVASTERAAAAAARDLQVSAMRVAAADAVRIAGGDPDESELEPAVVALGSDHSVALAALSPEDGARASLLLTEIAGCGSWLLDPAGEPHEVHDHDELQGLLDEAADTAARNASVAERTAVSGVLIALATSAIGLLWAAAQRVRSARRSSEVAATARTGERFAAIVADSPDIFLVIDTEGSISYRSASSDRLLPADATTTDDFVSLAKPELAVAFRNHLNGTTIGGESVVFELSLPRGRTGMFDVRVSDLTDEPSVRGRVVTARDVTAEHRLQGELRRQAMTDVLTGLPNRRALKSALQDAKRLAAHSSSMVTVFIMIDVDDFKEINDAFGHAVGDHLLRVVARRLAGTQLPDATVLRIGSDEFAVVATVQSAEIGLAHAMRLRQTFAEGFVVDGRTERLSGTVGVALATDSAAVDDLHGQAELALLAAKRQGSGLEVYGTSLEESIARSNRMRRALAAADYDNEFELVFQPIVTSDTSRVVGLEALLRWTSPTLGAVGPNEFIPIAEATGDICPIGCWVVENVCRQLATWAGAGMSEDLTVSFNVSARQLAEEGFVSLVSSTAKAWGIEPNRLVVEVTETVALDQEGVAVRRLTQLREAGFGVSIDDFGSGYSNLGQLLRVPFDVLKIDRSLLLMLTDMRETMGGDATDACGIIAAVASIAEVLGVPVVCEGVETLEQQRSLAASGITRIQGYLTGRPASADETVTLLGLDRGTPTASISMSRAER